MTAFPRAADCRATSGRQIGLCECGLRIGQDPADRSAGSCSFCYSLEATGATSGVMRRTATRRFSCSGSCVFTLR